MLNLDEIFDILSENWYIGVGFIAIVLMLVLIYLVLNFNEKKTKDEVVETVEVKEEPKTELEVVLKAMEENVNNRKALSFEQEQEENAIISYQELLEAAKGRRQANIEVTDPDRQELIDLIEQQPELEEVELVESEIVVPIEEPKKFKTSEFISPIFGKDEPIATESNDDFLAALKSFRSNL